MKISVVITVLNEESSIKRLLDSILKQTLKPDEIVIVDGGSNDKTQEIIKKYQEKEKSINLIIKKGNVASGRNEAIKNAKFDVIAQTDGGCAAKANWLEKITKEFDKKETMIVAGFYIMNSKSSFQKAVAPFHGVMTENFDPRNYLPSHRSVAFRKSVWEDVGGYSEILDRAGEDTLFNYEVLKKGYTITRVPDAIVYWDPPINFYQTLKKFYSYSKGDAQTGIWWHPAQKLATHNIKVMTIFARYAVFCSLFLAGTFIPPFMFLFILSFILYTSWTIHKMCRVVTNPVSLLLVPLIQISSDIMVMAGFVAGSISKGVE